jgi:hypothetical protein
VSIKSLARYRGLLVEFARTVGRGMTTAPLRAVEGGAA